LNSSALTRFRGWFSLGLGVTELVAPGAIARLSGMANRKSAIRLYGLREVAAGIGILSNRVLRSGSRRALQAI